MNDIVVSFCIASYQRYEVLRELVLEILSVESNKFDVIICDDHSGDGCAEQIKTIKDDRLKVYVNEKNAGGLLNICRALNCGDGKYLFFVNDRDNVDSFKVKKLISILEEFWIKKVAFAQCSERLDSPEDYQIFEAGEEAVLEFACRIVHPTGYVFRKEVWEKITNRQLLFEKPCYGDFSLTLIAGIMAKKYRGAWIYGDICNIKRERIDFRRIKSGYYNNRKDKRLWYSVGVQWRELMIAYRFMKKLDIPEDVADELMRRRYREYLNTVVIRYEDIISKPVNTIHYGLKKSGNPLKNKIVPIKNGLFLWSKMKRFCSRKGKRSLYQLVRNDTKLIFKIYLHGC